MALGSLLGLAFYLLTVHLLSGDGGLLRQAQQTSTLDIRFSELYVMVANSLRVAAAVCFVLLHEQPAVLLPLLSSATLLLLLWTLSFGHLFGAPVCAIRGIFELRALGDAAAAWAAACCLLELLTLPPTSAAEGSPPTRGSATPPILQLGEAGLHLSEVVCIGGWMAVALLGLIWRAHRRLLTERVSRAALLPTRECAQLALDVEQAWQAQGGVMGAMWAKHASSHFRL